MNAKNANTAEISYNTFKDSKQAYNIIQEHIQSLSQEQREYCANDLMRESEEKQRIYYALDILTHLLDTREVFLIANNGYEHRKLLIDILRVNIYPRAYIADDEVYYMHKLEYSLQAYDIIDFYIKLLIKNEKDIIQSGKAD